MDLGVVGAGVMGIGVTQCLARAGYSILVIDTDPAALSTGPRRLRDGLRLDRFLGCGGTSIETLRSRVHWTDQLSGLSGAAFVIECVRERVPNKERVFRELDAICPSRAVLASCTSAIPIARLAGVTGRSDRVLGMHFMNPARSRIRSRSSGRPRRVRKPCAARWIYSPHWIKRRSC